MSDSVVPTPSEQPKCGYELCDGPHKYMTTPPGRFTQYADCPGPVIATPEKCEHTLKEHFLALLDPRIGPFTGDKICQPVTVSTGAQTPASEATVTCDMRGRYCFTHGVHHSVGASDPTPELRDAIKAMEHVRNYAEDGTYFIALSRAQIDAVLAALKGEPK